MATFVQYRRVHEDALTQLQAEYTRLTPQEKSRRVLGRDNPLLYSSQEVADKMGGPGLSRQAVERGVRLDETPVPLLLEAGQDRRGVIRGRVHPRGDFGERARKIRGVEDQQRAQHLHIILGLRGIEWVIFDAEGLTNPRIT